MTRAEMLQALREAHSHVYRQQHYGRHEQDRADAKAWLERWVIPSNGLEHDPCNCVRCTAERAASRDTVDDQNEAEDFFIDAGIAAREALKAKARGEE
jgi:hypothetical protein